MQWDEVVEAARQISWVAYVGTADGEGRPHVAAVAPGFTDGRIWFATRASSKKHRNLLENPGLAFHWPVGETPGPGELAAWAVAEIHDTEEERRALWSSGMMPYDLAQFFESPDNPDLVFIEGVVSRVRLLGPDFFPDVWMP